MMMFLKVMAIGFAFTLGVELALGMCIAIGSVAKGAKKNEKC